MELVKGYCPHDVKVVIEHITLEELKACVTNLRFRLYISVKPSHPKSSVSRHAGSPNWNVKRTMLIEPDSDLQRL